CRSRLYRDVRPPRSFPTRRSSDLHHRIVSEGNAVDHHLEAVIFGRIVARRHHHSAVGIRQMEGGEIQYRRWHNTDVDDMTAGPQDAIDHRLTQRFAVQSAIPRHEDTGLALIQYFAAERGTDVFCQLQG